MSARARIVRAALTASRPLVVGSRFPYRVQRWLVDLAGALAPPPSGVSFRQATVAGVPGRWVTPPRASSEHAVVLLHGGGYVLGSSRSHRQLAGHLATAVGAPVFAVDYQRSPEAPYPSALAEAARVYEGLIADGFAADRIALVGDSAGGGLALAIALALRDRGAASPAALALMCPWLDLAPDLSDARVDTGTDPLLRASSLRRWAHSYVGETDPSDPGVSPLHGELAGLPPLIVHVATGDPLAPDGYRLARAARAAGVRVAERRLEGLWHDPHVLAGIVPEATAAVASVGRALAAEMGLAHPEPRIAIVGAGMAGLCMAHKLRADGHENVVVFEKADEVGGTWRENRYPGLACDVPSRFYSYSFAPNPSWTRAFSPGAEIQEYFVRASHRLGLRSMIRFGTEVTDAEWKDGRWQLTTANGIVEHADVLVTATGVLHHPKVPDIEGLERFSGTARHSARWDPMLETAGRRVGIIGTGSTGVQITEAIADEVAELRVFQRTAQWILPVRNRRYLAPTRIAFRLLPPLNRWAYRVYQRLLEAILGRAVLGPGWQHRAISALVGLNLRRGVRDPELRRRLTPDYEPMCKRLIMSAGFYAALQRPWVQVITERIARVEPGGVRTADGHLHELDVLILATGFDAHAYMRPMRIVGENGLTLEEAWSEGPRAYRTVALPGFPNLFTLMGPHSPIGNQSLIAVAEAQADYVVQWVRLLSSGEVAAAAPRHEVTDAYNAELRNAARHTVFATGCVSWYLDADGVPELWPWTPAHHRAMLGRPELDDFELHCSRGETEHATEGAR